MKKLSYLIVLLLILSFSLQAQTYGDATFRKKGTHAGNKIRTVFYNYGLVAGSVGGEPEGEWPIGSGNMYIGDVSPLLGVEAEQTWLDTFRYSSATTQDTLTDQSGALFTKFSIIELIDPVYTGLDGEDYPFIARITKTFQSVGTSDGPRGWTDGPLVGDNTWTFEPVPGYANSDTDLVALSTDLDNDGLDGLPNTTDDDGIPDSWPLFWPDKLNDAEDPGWAGSWNGYFGKNVKNADQESYFVMDDNNDREFNYRVPGDVSSGRVFSADSLNDLRYGMGLSVAVRGMQWSHFLAEDAIFWLYDVTNQSTTNYEKTAFGMMVGTLAGGRCGDSNDDLAFFDAENDITYSFDSPPAFSPCFDGPVGYAGYAFLESPGNAVDGIDNDGDNAADGLAPFFEPAVFAPVSFDLGDQIIVIDAETFERSIVTLDADTNEIYSQGRVVQIITTPGSQNVFREDIRNLLDDNFNGIIDEDTLNHYVNRINRTIDNVLTPLPPFQYVDYFTNVGGADLMLDERRDDGIDNDGDWEEKNDDVGLDGVALTGDFGEGDGMPTSGYQPGADGRMVDTGLPGEPHVDKTDIDESDQIGLTSFTYFTPPGQTRMSNDAQLWSKLTPSIDVANDIETKPVDGDFIYGAGFFPLMANQTERFSVGLVFGEDFFDILNNKITIQSIYDNNYNFAKPPDRPIVRAVAGDGKVTLYWDDLAEFSYDPVNGFDFEGYKIYRATDFGFNEANNITDGFGNKVFYEPVAQFDLMNEIKGFYDGDLDIAQGAAFFLGKDNGLSHAWTDTTVTNGQEYFYAVVSYDRGSDTFYPAECSKTILELNGTMVYDQNTVGITPNDRVAGYVPPATSGIDHIAGSGAGTVELVFLDETDIKDNANYELSFQDMSNDGIDNDQDWVAFYNADDAGVYDEAAGDTILHDTGSDGLWASDSGMAVYRRMGIRDVFMGIYHGPDSDGTEGNGTPDPGEPKLDANDPDELQEMTTTYSLTREIEGVEAKILSNSANFNSGTVNYQNVHDNYGLVDPDIRQGSKVNDGMRFIFNNVWRVEPDVDRIRMNRSEEEIPELLYGINSTYNSKKIPHDYAVVFSDDSVGTSIPFQGVTGALLELPINFHVRDLITDEIMPLVGYKPIAKSARDFITYITHQTAEQDSFITWFIRFSFNDTITQKIVAGVGFVIDTAYSDIGSLGTGDSLLFYTTKPFSIEDKFRYSTVGADVASLEDEDWQKNVRVVPNPYLAAASWESVNRFATGRGERRIDFIHLPPDCEIRLYTIRGDHIQTIEHDGNIFDGTASWNLKTKEGLDIAYGVYIYHIDAGKAGESIGKLAIIK